MDFMGISVWVFEFLVLQMLPLFSIILLLVGIVKVIQYLPDTLTKYAKEQAKRLNKGLK